MPPTAALGPIAEHYNRPRLYAGFVLVCAVTTVLYCIQYFDAFSVWSDLGVLANPEIQQKESMTFQKNVSTQEQRKWRIKKGCTTLDLDYVSPNRIYIDDENKILYCFPPKAGCSVWKRAIGLVNGKTTDAFILDMTKRLSPNTYDFNPSAFVHSNKYLGVINLKRAPWPLPKRTDSYYKIAWTRNPYQRLVSAYQDKIAITGGDQRRGGGIVNLLTKRARKATRDGFGPFSFQALLSLLRDIFELKTPATFDPHFNTFYSLCRPCEVQYDFIGSTDTQRKDSEYIFKDVFRTKLSTDFLLNQTFGPSTSRSKHTSTKDMTRKFYTETPEDLRQVLKDYLLPDCLLFGYDPDHWT